ncbi:hypothetical protein M885DRAFT_589452 [Pelagophyceae sp. CCMP2097]|nr:hypothetical protein M885DRAFT_589452 [Pelagophyceae sp. CCMP2097]
MMLSPWLALPVGYSFAQGGFRWLGWELRSPEERRIWAKRTAKRLAAALLAGSLVGGVERPQLRRALGCALAIAACTDTYAHNVAGNEPDVSGAASVGSVLVTGATSGVGRAAAVALVRLGCDVIVTARSAEAAARTAAEITKEAGPAEGRALFVDGAGLELADQASVRLYARALSDRLGRGGWRPLSVLVLNAGVMLPALQRTPDGAEMTLACNHLGHHTLALLLMPDLEKASKRGYQARIVVVSSALHAQAARQSLEDLDDFSAVRWPFSLFEAYSRSKLVNVVWAEELQRRLQAEKSSVTCVSLHPGIVLTGVTRSLPWFVRAAHLAALPIMCLLQKSPQFGARTTVHAALAADVRRRLESGLSLYLADCRFVTPATEALDARLRLNLGTNIFLASEDYARASEAPETA